MNIRDTWLCTTLAISLAGFSACSPEPTKDNNHPVADWRTTRIDNTTILVQADFTAYEHSRYIAPGKSKNVGDWRWNRNFVSAARIAQASRPAIEDALTNSTNWKIDGNPTSILGYWKNATGQSRYPDAALKTNIAYAADVVYNIFLAIPKNSTTNRHPSISGPFNSLIQFSNTDLAQSPFIKVNQVGYIPSAKRKYAYVGGWLGIGGAWQPPAEATSFKVINASNDETVLIGNLVESHAEGHTPEGTPWYGENPLIADISALSTPGEYFLSIPGIGRSAIFKISNDGIRHAFATCMHGLFIQRCGCTDKRKPFTHWEDNACHTKVMRGTFPPDLDDYGGAPKKRQRHGFMDASGHAINTKHFDVIALNATGNEEVLHVHGGWHDAADYDRRPMHLRIVNNLAGLYILKPDNFHDGDLNLPENHNGIPDILDEAAWGIEHLRLSQQPDGGVGTWIESTGHPVEGMGMPSVDTSAYYISRATRASTLSYCASAALLSRLHPKLKERFLDSALKAWRFVHSHQPAEHVPMTSCINGKETQLFWTENKELPCHELLKAAINLSVATKDNHYLNDILTTEFAAAFNKTCDFSWGALKLVELESSMNPRLAPYRDRMRNIIIRGAEKQLRILNENRAYFTTWHAPWKNPSTGGMAWGNSLPFNSADWIIVAHAITKERKYIDAAQLLFDFHCGCNPSGMTLTTGLGDVYPISILHLHSSADNIAEVAPGITPYCLSSRLPKADNELVHTDAEQKLWPIWRRHPNLESLSIATSEFTVYETIGPSAIITGYLMDTFLDGSHHAMKEPANDVRQLRGYWTIP